MSSKPSRQGTMHTLSDQSVKERITRSRKQNINVAITADAALVVPSDPRLYADAVSVYSNLTGATSLTPGLHFGPFAEFLQRPHEVTAPVISSPKDGNHTGNSYAFVTLYDLSPTSRRAMHLDSIQEFEAQAGQLLDQSDHGQLLFMRGQPTPAWVLAIAAKYRVDPVFFQRHLDFQHENARYYECPSLPSTASTMTRLRITTIGDARSDSGSSYEDQELVEALREDSIEMLKRHHETLRSSHDLKLGDSIVRDSLSYDAQTTTVEQDISIWVGKSERSWTTIVWLDVGQDFDQGSSTMWLMSPATRLDKQWWTRYLPTIQQKSNVAFSPRSCKRVVRPSDTESRAAPSCQSASLLHLDYGRDLDRHAVAADSFYALHEIFTFTACSESQFLNMLHSKLVREISRESILGEKNMTLSNMLYYQHALKRHIERIEENIESILSHTRASWPRQNFDVSRQAVTENASNVLLRDYEDLLRRAKELHMQCNSGMQLMMSNASIRESQKAITQAEEVTKLTRLAFIFVPLSFTTSFFGMNFSQLGTGTLSIWIWIVIVVPLLIAALIFMQHSLRRKTVRAARYLLQLISGSRSGNTTQSGSLVEV